MTAFTAILALPIIGFGRGSNLSPPLEFPFDVSKKEQFVVTDFSILEHRNYIFAVRFQYDADTDLDRVRKLIGDGALKVYTKESADTANPELVISETAADVTRLNEGLRSGKYVLRPTDFRGQIPLAIKISSLIDSGDATDVYDAEVNTLGYFAHGFGKSGRGGYFDRLIVKLQLKNGQYRLQVGTRADSLRFADISTKLVVTFRPNEQPLDN